MSDLETISDTLTELDYNELDDGDSLLDDGDSLLDDGDSLLDDGDSLLDDGDSLLDDDYSLLDFLSNRQLHRFEDELDNLYSFTSIHRLFSLFSNTINNSNSVLLSNSVTTTVIRDFQISFNSINRRHDENIKTTLTLDEFNKLENTKSDGDCSICLEKYSY